VDRTCIDLERAGYAVWAYDLDTAPEGRHRGRFRYIFVAHTNGESQSRRTVDAEVASVRRISRCGRTDDAAPMGMDDGIPGRMDRLHALGNAVSPGAIEAVGRAILASRRAAA
jgi:DNA (cytosine-5)-methyltransferase 1